MTPIVYPERSRQQIGDIRWYCEWTTLPLNWRPEFEGDGAGPDDVVYHRTYHRTQASAMQDAKKRIEDDYFGRPRVVKQVVDWLCEEDRVAEWTDAGDPVYPEEA